MDNDDKKKLLIHLITIIPGCEMEFECDKPHTVYVGRLNSIQHGYFVIEVGLDHQYELIKYDRLQSVKILMP